MRSWFASGSSAVLLAALLWGTTGTVAALAPNVSGLGVGAAAMGVGGLLQAATACRQIRRHSIMLRGQWPTLWVSAVAVAVCPLAFYTSMRLTGVAIGTVVTIGSAPPASALIERVMDGARLSGRWAAGTSAGIVGIVALAVAHPGAGTEITGTSRGATEVEGLVNIAGIVLGLLGGVTYSIYSYGASRVMQRGVPNRATMGTVFGLGGLLLMPVVVLTGSPIVASRGNVAVVAYLALIPMFVGYLLFGHGLATSSASTATALSLVEPAAATVIAMLVLHEEMNVTAATGLALLCASMVIVTSRPGRRDSSHDPVAGAFGSEALSSCWEPAPTSTRSLGQRIYPSRSQSWLL